MRTANYLIKNKRTVIMLTLLSVVLICCKSLTPANKATASKPSLAPDSTDVTIARTHWAGTSTANLTQGYTIFSDKCTECHGVKNPQDFSINDWNNILPEMGKKANLDSVQYRYVYQYILAKREAILSGKN
jgi:cytochrome c5